MAALKILQHPAWQAFDWLVHGFTTRTGGHSTVYSRNGVGELNLGFTPADDRETVLQNRQLLFEALRLRQLTTVSQIHSATIHKVDGSELPPSGDGLLTATPGVSLAIMTADCVPILVADVRQRVVSAFHAGWRGTAQRIVERGAARLLDDFSSQPEDLRALIGPAIGPCCYQVGAELRQEFAAQFFYASALFTADMHLDLIEANRRQLLAGGLHADHIGRVGDCTSCHPGQYFSHRQSGGHTGRMMSVIGIR